MSICVQASPSDPTWGSTSVCTLPGNITYTVPYYGTITVGRAPLTIQGSGPNSTLRRSDFVGNGTGHDGRSDALITVPSFVGLVGSGPYTITVRDLRIDGNRGGQCFSFGDCNTPGTFAGKQDHWNWTGTEDISIRESDQPVSVLIDNLTLFDANRMGIAIYRGKYNVNNVRIEDSFFGLEQTGKGCAFISCVSIWKDPTVFGYNTTADLPYNPQILWTHFYGSGTGGLGIANAAYAQIMVDDFFDNHREFSFASAGGQLTVSYSPIINTTATLLYANTIDGNWAYSSAYAGTVGLELESTTMTVDSNWIFRHMGAAQAGGVGMNGVTCAKLSSNVIEENGGDTQSYPMGTIVIKAETYPQTHDIYLTNNTIRNNSLPGLWVWSEGNGAANIDYSANMSNTSLVYFNFRNGTDIAVEPTSVGSQIWNPSCGVLP